MPARTSERNLDMAVQMYMQCANATTVQAETGVSRSVIYRALRERGIKPSAVVVRLGKAHQKSRLNFSEMKVVAERYESGEAASKIARDMGVDRMTVVAAVRKSGVAVKPRGQAPLKVTPEMQEAIQRLWDEGHTQTHIAKIIGLNQGTVSAWLRSGRVPVKSRTFKKSRFHYQKEGGRILSQEGYVLLHIHFAPTEYHSLANIRGYILEHRLVMSQVLGRPLTSTETVHHIDGNKQNNAAENLQLRHGKHGKGVILRCACCGSTDIISGELGS